MKSKISFFNIHIILEDLKRYWGVAALYFLTLFFIGPLHILSLFNNEHPSPYYEIEDFLQLPEYQTLLSMVFPILLAMLIFRYLQQKKSTTVMHSFPITRGELFHSHNIAGVLLLVIPVLLNAIILMMILSANNDGSKLFQEIFTLSNIFKWTWLSTLTNFVVYFISALVAMISGVSLVQGILSIIFIFLPIGFSFLMVMNFEQLLYGFTFNEQLFEKFIGKIIPITTAFISNKTIDSKFALWYVILSIILYFATYYFYKKRHLESASDPIAFDLLKPIFKYGFTFCAMVLGGAYFYMMERTDSWLYIGYFIGAFLGYIIAEMIIQKSIWIFKNLKGLIIYSMVILVLFGGIKFDLFGYEKRIPNEEDIQSVYYGSGLYGYWSGERDPLKTAENIHLVRELHTQLIEHKDAFLNEKENKSPQCFAYKLKNGKTIIRKYDIPREFIDTNKTIHKLYESTEYKMNYYGIFDLDINKINYIRIDPRLKNTDTNIKIIEPDKIRKMLNAMKTDVLDQSYEEFISEKSAWANIEIYYDSEEKDLNSKEKHDSIYLQWEKHHAYLSKWLKENEYYEKVRVMPNDIDYIIVEKTSEDIKNRDHYSRRELEKEFHNKEDKNKKRLEIKDKEKIEEILINNGEYWGEPRKYLIGIYYTTGDNNLLWMSEKNAPQFIKNFFK